MDKASVFGVDYCFPKHNLTRNCYLIDLTIEAQQAICRDQDHSEYCCEGHSPKDYNGPRLVQATKE